MIENGADLLQAKRDDGLTAVHFAASNNDVHLLDYIFNDLHRGQSDNAKKIANIENK